jgi:hypothetical protein
MDDLKPKKHEETQEELPESWSDRARDAARRFNLPPPENAPDPEEVERRLREFEQDDGE